MTKCRLDLHEPMEMILAPYRTHASRTRCVWSGPARTVAWWSVVLAGLLGGVLVLGVLCQRPFRGERIEQAIMHEIPGLNVRIGRLQFDWRERSLIARQLEFTHSNPPCSGEVSEVRISGWRWASGLFGNSGPGFALSEASVDATNVVIRFPESAYVLRCGRIRAQPSTGEAECDALEFRPFVSDEAFFGMHNYRRARLHLTIPQITVKGFNSRLFFREKQIEIEQAALVSGTLSALINRDKPVNTNPRATLMPNEALMRVKFPLRIETLFVRDGHINLEERETVGKEPGRLTFDHIDSTIANVSNRGTSNSMIGLRGQCRFMNTAELKGVMEIPVQPQGWSFRYAATLGEMDLALLNSFLAVTTHTRLQSGVLSQASCQIEVVRGQARGVVEGRYGDLKLGFLDPETGKEGGVVNRLKSFAADHGFLRTSNPAGKNQAPKSGEVEYSRRTEEKFLHLVWFAIRSGIVDVLGISGFVKDPN